MGVPHGAERPAFKVARGNGLIARVAQKAAGTALDASVDVYFGAEAGAEVDTTGMRRLESGAPPGFIVMAADPSEGARLLFSGWAEALASQVHDPRSALSDATRPWVLLLRRRVSLARMAAVGSAGDVERFARAGAALVKHT